MPYLIQSDSSSSHQVAAPSISCVLDQTLDFFFNYHIDWSSLFHKLNAYLSLTLATNINCNMSEETPKKSRGLAADDQLPFLLCYITHLQDGKVSRRVISEKGEPKLIKNIGGLEGNSQKVRHYSWRSVSLACPQILSVNIG